MKKWLATIGLTIGILIAGVVPVSASEADCDTHSFDGGMVLDSSIIYTCGNCPVSYSLEIVEENGTLAITSLTTNAEPDSLNIIIPSEIDGKAVKTISNCASTGIHSVCVQEGVETIGFSAFARCNNLVGIELPDSIVSIGAFAFKDCENLEEITIPNGVKTIEMETFRKCKNLKNIVIPNSVVAIREYAFEGCDKLLSMTIPTNLELLGLRAFGLRYNEVSQEYTAIDGFKAYLHEGSIAESYCKKYVMDYSISFHEGGNATCVQGSICTICGNEYGEIAKTNHPRETIVVGDCESTCGTTGYTGDICCKYCNEVLTKGTYTSPKGDHVWDNGKVLLNPTNSTPGKREINCTVCGAREIVEIPAKEDNKKPTSGNTSGIGLTQKASMYRLYNPNSGEHFYTASAGEKNNLIRLGWKYEGIGWTAPKTSKTPVYRLYNPNAGDHHYTANNGEKVFLVSVGWNYEGIGWYSDDEQGVPIYRQYNPNAKAGAHNYTSNKGEVKYLVKTGWHDEGIAWYGFKSGNGDSKTEIIPTPIPNPSDRDLPDQKDYFNTSLTFCDRSGRISDKITSGNIGQEFRHDYISDSREFAFRVDYLSDIDVGGINEIRVKDRFGTTDVTSKKGADGFISIQLDASNNSGSGTIIEVDYTDSTGASFSGRWRIFFKRSGYTPTDKQPIITFCNLTDGVTLTASPFVLQVSGCDYRRQSLDAMGDVPGTDEKQIEVYLNGERLAVAGKGSDRGQDPVFEYYLNAVEGANELRIVMTDNEQYSYARTLNLYYDAFSGLIQVQLRIEADAIGLGTLIMENVTIDAGQTVAEAIEERLAVYGYTPIHTGMGESYYLKGISKPGLLKGWYVSDERIGELTSLRYTFHEPDDLNVLDDNSFTNRCGWIITQNGVIINMTMGTRTIHDGDMLTLYYSLASKEVMGVQLDTELVLISV